MKQIIIDALKQQHKSELEKLKSGVDREQSGNIRTKKSQEVIIKCFSEKKRRKHNYRLKD